MATSELLRLVGAGSRPLVGRLVGRVAPPVVLGTLRVIQLAGVRRFRRSGGLAVQRSSSDQRLADEPSGLGDATAAQPLPLVELVPPALPLGDGALVGRPVEPLAGERPVGVVRPLRTGNIVACHVGIAPICALLRD